MEDLGTAQLRPGGSAHLFPVILVAAYCALPPLAAAAPCHDYNEVPHQIGQVDTPGEAWGVATAPGIVFVADGSAGLQVIDVTNPAAPQLIGSGDTPGVAQGIAAGGNYVYIADGASGFAVFDVSNPQSPVAVGGTAIPGLAQRVVVAGSFAYVAAGQTGLQIVDISNPISPFVIGGVDTPGNACDVAASGPVACIADDTSLKVIDISNPAVPTVIGSWSTNDAERVDIENDQVYLTGLSDYDNDIQVLDISDPTNPIPVFQWLDYGHHDIEVAEGIALIGTCTSLQILDASVLQCMRIIANVPFAPPFNCTPRRAVAMDGDLAFVTNGTSGLLVIGSIHAGPLLGMKLFQPTPLQGGPNDIAVRNVGSSTIAYLSTFFNDIDWSVWIVDFTEPVCVGNLTQRVDGGFGVAVDGNRLYACASISQSHRLKIYDVSNPFVPVFLGHLSGNYWRVDASGAFAFATMRNPSTLMRIIDVSDPGSPFVVGEVDMGGGGGRIVQAGGHAYVATTAGLRIIDVSTPTSPVLVGAAGGSCHELVLQGDWVYAVSQNPNALLVFDVSDPEQPALAATLPFAQRPRHVAAGGEHVYVGLGFDGLLLIIDVTDPASPAIAVTASMGTGPMKVHDGKLAMGTALLPLQCPATTAVEEPLPVTPSLVTARADPNPFHAHNVFEYGLSRSTQVRLRVYDVEGRLVRVLQQGKLQSEGVHRAMWDGADEGGNRVGTGVYFYKLETGSEQVVRRVVRLK